MLAVLLTIGITACQPQPAVTPTPTRTPAAVVVPPTVAPTAVVTQPPPAPSSAGRVGPDAYPAGVNPLTGLPVADPAVLQRPPLAIKVSNYIGARPQSGLSYADLVFEHYAEGGETRLTGVYYSQSPERVGSVRSGRLIDLEIVPMFDALLTASGFSGGVLKRIDAAPWKARNLSGPFIGPPMLVRVPLDNVAYEHTLFAVPAEIWQYAARQGISQPPMLTPGMAFDPSVPPGGVSASKAALDFGLSWTEVSWQYDPAAGRYLRMLAGEPHTDALNGQQIAVENVVLIGAWHIETDIPEDSFGGGHLSVEIQIWGSGPLTLFRDGQRFEGQWTRSNPENMLAFTDANGGILYLKPGQTWFEMVPIGFDQLLVEP